MTRNQPKPGTPLDLHQLVEKLDSARGSLAHDIDVDYYDRHHSERGALDTVFDDLIEFVRGHQTDAELVPLLKPHTDPDLQPGDLINLDGRRVTVRELLFHAPHTHPDSGLPSHHPAREIVTGHGSQFLSLIPQV